MHFSIGSGRWTNLIHLLPFLPFYFGFYTLLPVLLFYLIWFLVTTNWFNILIHTGQRDITGLIRFLRCKYFLYTLAKKKLSVPLVFIQNAKKHPNRIAIKFNDENWTFEQLDIYSNKVANVMIEAGFQHGEEIALMMQNKPQYIAIWLGLAKAGLVTAFLNINQRQESLAHSISVVNCKAIIYDAEYSQAIEDVREKLDKNAPLTYFCAGKPDHKFEYVHFIDELINESSAKYPSSLANTKLNDRLFYIYTSGTTGMPKAAIIKQHRYIWMGTALRNMINLQANRKKSEMKYSDCENIYTCLPLYHLAGGCIGTCQCIIFGDTLSIAKKFSASRFWQDCKKFNCTSGQYIGEICRYLLAQPASESDKDHNVTLMFGNGLRPKIWRKFINRFQIKQVGEFYGSTEGNANVINMDNKEGSCGFISLLIPRVYPVCLIKLDEKTNLPLRDENGLCQRCSAGESGEFVGKIVRSDPTRSFDGYINEKATKKKIIRDVFCKGDEAFLSGDLLTIDQYGYLYFKDRTGDTYRWKGENISTTEVESVISNAIDQTDCIVFGTEIRDCEGKAGMAVINSQLKETDLDYLLIKMQQVLPKFAIPVFIRLAKEIEMTGTFKMPKNKLQEEAYDITKFSDLVYYLDSKKNKYSLVNEKVLQDIMNGNIKL